MALAPSPKLACRGTTLCHMDMISKMRDGDRFARLCGVEIVSVGDGASLVRMTVRPDHLNALNMVHGGAIFTMADFAFALAANSRDVPSVALSVSVNFLRPGRAGVLTATAREVSVGSKVGTYDVQVRDEAGELLAVFQGLAYRKVELKKPLAEASA